MEENKLPLNTQEGNKDNIEQTTQKENVSVDISTQLFIVNETISRKESVIKDTQQKIGEVRNELGLSPMDETAPSILMEQSLIKKLGEEKIKIENFSNNFIKKKEDNKEGVDFVFEQNLELIKIGTKEQYLEYLNSIFPESKIKNIAYHDSDIGGIEEFSKTDNGIFATGDKNWWQKRLHKYALLINTENPKIIKTPINSDVSRDFIENPVNESYDSLITTGDSENVSDGVYVLKNPNQIHILGSKKDIDDFRNLISKKNNNSL